MEVTKKNTLMFEFPKDAIGPSLIEMSRFVKKLTADRTMIDTCYRNADEKCVYLRFKTVEAFNDAVLHNPEIQTFEYSDGSAVQLKMSVAGGMYKYVRIFNLPPEVSDEEIGRVLAKYGRITKQIKEKFPPECELDVYSGIRGVYMDIQKQIPASLFIRNNKARIYYDGYKNRCFYCKADDHLKVDCPQLQEMKNKDNEAGVSKTKSADNVEQGQLLYATVAAGARTPLAQRLVNARKIEADNESQCNDKVLDITASKSDISEETVPHEDPNGKSVMECDETRNETSVGSKRALRSSQSTSDESNDEQANKGKTKKKKYYHRICC